MDLTPRQTSLLKAIIEEYGESPDPVSSKTIVQKYLRDVSSATVRNEMAELSEKGLLEKPHASAGREPTPMAYRHYINYLMEEKELPVLEEVAIKQRLWQERFELEKLLRNASLALAEGSGVLGVVVTEDGIITSAGAANILEHPEFYDIDVTKAVLSLLDRPEVFQEIFGKAVGEKDVHVLIGDEIGFPGLVSCSIISSPFKVGQRKGRVSVVGPARMPYKKVIPLASYVGSLMNEIGRAW